MTITTSTDNGPARQKSPDCPHCSAPLTIEEDGASHYWSCRSCNLVFLA